MEEGKEVRKNDRKKEWRYCQAREINDDGRKLTFDPRAPTSHFQALSPYSLCAPNQIARFHWTQVIEQRKRDM